MNKNAEVYDLKCTILRKTDKAVLVGVADGSEHWFPLSLVEVYEKDGIVVLPQWLIEKEGVDQWVLY